MHSFKDSKDRNWDLVVNVNTCKSVYDNTGTKLLTVFSDDEAQKLLSDPCQLVNVLYVLCKDQCTKYTVTETGNTRPLSDIEFGESMIGDALEHGSDALLKEIIDFFPKRRQIILKELMNKSELAATEMEKKTLKALQELDTTKLYNSVTPLVESSKSIPANSPSVN